MKIGIGIDTGGTYTDAVIYDKENNTLIAKAKALTTKEDLSIGISNVIDLLPVEYLKNSDLLCLSTTLATNACVENKGSRAKLILMGIGKNVLEWVDSKKQYGLDHADVLCMDVKTDMNADPGVHFPWSDIIKDNDDWFAQAQAFSIAEIHAVDNGGAYEEGARIAITEHFDRPFVMASELVGDLNTIERGVTALLNAKLLPLTLTT